MRERGKWSVAAGAAVAAVLLAAPVAGAHELFEERAETAVERYAGTVQGGSTGTLSVQTPEGETNIMVTRYDAGRCRRRTVHVRVCPLVYEGEDYLEERCAGPDAPINADPNFSESTRECFRNVVCRQTVVVTLRGPHQVTGPRSGSGRDLSLRASDIRCELEGNSTSPNPTP